MIDAQNLIDLQQKVYEATIRDRHKRNWVLAVPGSFAHKILSEHFGVDGTLDEEAGMIRFDAPLEYVERAAVRVTAVYWREPERSYVFEVPRPLRHDSAIRAAVAALRLDRIGEHEQGFVTSTGRFVDREEAGRLAHVSGQVDKLKENLTSEDVW